VRRRLRAAAIYGVAALLAFWVLVPFGWMVVTSFSTSADALQKPIRLIPAHPTMENYLTFFGLSDEGLSLSGKPGDSRAYAYNAVKGTPRALLNSLVVALTASVCILVVASMGAYSFVRYPLPFGTALLTLLLGTRMIPSIAIMIPIYQMFELYHLIDSLLALILAYTTFLLPFSIWVLKSYFQTIPRDLEDAALVDGCNWGRMMWHVFLPVALPGLIATGMFTFMASWDEFLYALLLTTSGAARTIPVVVSLFAVDLLFKEMTLLMTAGVLAVIAPLLLALGFQRVIIRGLAAGAVRG
jgi:multiple sugar transport system permease protein